MTKAVKILNKYQIKEMLLSGNIQYENFYKEELIQICKVANEMVENSSKENQKYKEAINKIYEIINYEYDFYDDIAKIKDDIQNILNEVK